MEAREENEAFSVLFSERGFSTFETNHTSIHFGYLDLALVGDTEVIN